MCLGSNHPRKSVIYNINQAVAHIVFPVLHVGGKTPQPQHTSDTWMTVSVSLSKLVLFFSFSAYHLLFLYIPSFIHSHSCFRWISELRTNKAVTTVKNFLLDIKKFLNFLMDENFRQLRDSADTKMSFMSK